MKSPVEIGKVWAITKKDFHDWSSYKSQILSTLLTAGVGTAAWGFNGTYRNIPVPQYNTDYVSFLIMGILVGSIITSITTGLLSRMKPWTLETVLMTGINSPTFVVGTASWTYLLTVILFIPQLALGILLFGVHLDINILSFALAIVISSVIIFSLTMISIGIRLVTKVIDPITYTLVIASQLFSGMTFPVQHLDNYIPGLSNVSWVIPQTWVYHLIRLASLEGAGITDPSAALSFGEGGIIAAIMLPIGLAVFRWGLRRAKRDGTLGWY